MNSSSGCEFPETFLFVTGFVLLVKIIFIYINAYIVTELVNISGTTLSIDINRKCIS